MLFSSFQSVARGAVGVELSRYKVYLEGLYCLFTFTIGIRGKRPGREDLRKYGVCPWYHIFLVMKLSLYCDGYGVATYFNI